MKPLWMAGILACGLLMASCNYNPFGKKQENDQDSKNLEAPRVETAETVTPIPVPDVEEPEPTKIKEKKSVDEWENITLKGYTEFNNQKFPIKIEAKVKYGGRWPKYKNGMYYNINHKATFPVDMNIENGTLYIERSGKPEDMQIIVYQDYGSSDWTGTMITKTHVMDCYLDEY